MNEMNWVTTKNLCYPQKVCIRENYRVNGNDDSVAELTVHFIDKPHMLNHTLSLVSKSNKEIIENNIICSTNSTHWYHYY